MFLIANMSEDSVYDVLILNASVRRIDDDSDRASTEATDLDIEDAFKPLCPWPGKRYSEPYPLPEGGRQTGIAE